MHMQLYDEAQWCIRRRIGRSLDGMLEAHWTDGRCRCLTKDWNMVDWLKHECNSVCGRREARFGQKPPILAADKSVELAVLFFPRLCR